MLALRRGVVGALVLSGAGAGAAVAAVVVLGSRRGYRLQTSADEFTTPLQEAVRERAGPPQVPYLEASAHGLRGGSPARTALGQSVWEPLRADAFECYSKYQWLDLDKSWCHLCAEPIGGNVGVHIGERDHVCIALFLYMTSLYPRDWSYRRVLRAALGRHPKLGINTLHDPTCQDHLHTAADEVRRCELHALLVALSQPPHGLLRHALQRKATMSLTQSGERMFKQHLSRLVSVMLPAMSPGVHTQFTHKCWGRSNLERMYDALRIADIKEGYFGSAVETTYDGRATWMRVLLWELMTAQTSRGAEGATLVMVEETLRRLAFEMVHHMSMYYMHRAQDAFRRAGCPSTQTLHDLSCM